jgi:hypothetical protein
MEGRLVYYGDHIALDKHDEPVLQLPPGTMIELRIMNYWIPGRVERDRSGWYLVSFDQVGIRLRAGLIARFSETPHAWTYFPQHAQANEQREERS